MSNQNICNICGGNYEYVNGRWVCPFCGAFKPEEVSNEEVTLLYNARQKLATVDFDEAEKLFDLFIEQYPNNPDGYWGRLCAKYGIKFEIDSNGKQKPTCFVQMGKITDDPDYQKALDFSSTENRSVYEQYGIYLDGVLSKYQEIVKTVDPYDVFICYKQTANGENTYTPEAKWARSIYRRLKECGLRVFFAEECLSGSNLEYEPHIFAALQKARIMFVLGSSVENLKSTWVKNEWQRYLKLQEKDDSKTLRLVLNGINHGDLPKGLREVKTQDIDINDGEWVTHVISAARESSQTPQKGDFHPRVLEKDQTDWYAQSMNAFKKIYSESLSQNNKNASKHTESLLILSLLQVAFNDDNFDKKEAELIAGYNFDNDFFTLLKPHQQGNTIQTFEDLYNASDNDRKTFVMLAEQVIKDTLYDDIMLAFKGLPSAEKADQYWDIINSNARNIIRQVQFADGQLDETERSKGCLITDLLFDMSDAIYDIKESEKTRIQEKAKRDAEIELEKLSQKEEKKKKKQERRQKVKDFFQWHPKLKKFLIWTCVLSILILTGTILIRNFLDRTNLKYREVTGGYEVYCAPSYQSDLELVIPKTYNGKNVVAIAENGFTNQDDIISVVIPDTVKTIGKKAFYNCNKLSKVTLPNNLLKIEDSAFQKTALTEVTIPSSLSYVGKYAFADCEILKNVLVENSLDLMAGWSKEWKGDSTVLLDVFYNITFDCSGIETKISTLILKPGEQIVFEVPTKAGYQFLCWNNGQYNVSDSEGHLIATINSSCTLSPVWKANLNTVKFNANGGTGTMDEINVHTDESISLSRCLFKREGCIFLGWSDTAKGDKKWNDQQLFTMGSSSSYTLYAVWLPYTSTIVFNSESGKRNQLITDSAFYDEVVNFGMDIEKLKSFGYTAFTVSVTLECCEIDDGNQLLYVKDPKQGEVAYFRIEHGPNTLDESWGSHTVDFTVLFDKLANNSKYFDHFIFRWGASGLFDDDWMLGTTTIVITAIK